MASALHLNVDALSQRYGDLVLFSSLSFGVPAGKALVVTGDNGSGKSTLLRTLAGLMPPAAGSVRLDGGVAEVSVAEQCHLVSYQNAIKMELTCRQNLTQWREIQGAGGANGVEAALERLGLDRFADMPALVLSTGWRRKLALARVLVAHRPLWLLDEPTAALDLAASRIVAEMIGEHLAAGGLAVIATHLELELDGVQTLDLTAQAATS